MNLEGTLAVKPHVTCLLADADAMVYNSAVIYIPCQVWAKAIKRSREPNAAEAFHPKQRKGLCTSASQDAEHGERRRESSSVC